MRKYITSFGYILFFIFQMLIMACSKQNEPKPLIIDPQPQLTPGQEANLLSYKKSKHQLFFAWINQNPATPSMQSRLTGIPDSVDIVSAFTGYVNNKQNREDVKYLQEHKGTRVVLTLFSEPYFEKNPKNLDSMVRYANNLVDSIKAWGLDGFDLDYEPGYGGARYTDEMMETFLKTMSKHFGPESGTGKLLIADGVWIHPKLSHYLDYFIGQVYNVRSENLLDGEFSRRVKDAGLPPEKFIIAEWTSRSDNFYPNGGIQYSDLKGNVMPSIWGYAKYNPSGGGQKAGIGSYVLQFGYSTPNNDGLDNPPNDYYYIRRAIQLMNPAVK